MYHCFSYSEKQNIVSPWLLLTVGTNINMQKICELIPGNPTASNVSMQFLPCLIISQLNRVLWLIGTN